MEQMLTTGLKFVAVTVTWSLRSNILIETNLFAGNGCRVKSEKLFIITRDPALININIVPQPQPQRKVVTPLSHALSFAVGTRTKFYWVPAPTLLGLIYNPSRTTPIQH